MKTVISIVAVAGVAAAAVANPAKIYDTSVSAILAPGSTGGSALRSVNEFYGFETSEGYTAGSALAGQNGWTEFTAAPGAAQVSTANPASGSQHVRIVNDPNNANGTLTGPFSPDLGAQAAGRYITSVDLAISNTGGADYDVVAQAPSQGALTFRVNFSFTGAIRVLDGGTFVDTGTAWVVGDYANLTVDLDGVAGTIDYFYDGNLIYSATSLVNGTSVEQAIVLTDNFQLAGETGDFDNLSIAIPAPGAMALLGLGGLAATRRRR